MISTTDKKHHNNLREAILLSGTDPEKLLVILNEGINCLELMNGIEFEAERQYLITNGSHFRDELILA